MILDFSFCIKEVITAFVVLFAIIDIIGAIPIIIGLNNSGKVVKAGKTSILSFILLVVFLFLGEGLLNFFGVDIASFAIAGGIILLALAIEMTFDIEVFHNGAPEGGTAIIPMVFPLIAGAGTLTTTLSLRAEVSFLNLIIAIGLNMVVVYFVIKKLNLVERVLGQGGIYILRKFFGVILLAMSVKLIVTNLTVLLQ